MIEEGYRILSNDFHEAYRLLYLIRAFILKKLSSSEREELDAWLEQSDENIELFERLTDDQHIPDTLALYEQMREDDALRRVKNRIPFMKPKQKKVTAMVWLSVAATVVVLAGIGLSTYLKQRPTNSTANTNTQLATTPAQLIKPGGNHAMLILENGSQIVLDSAANGRLTTGAGIEVEKTNGEISYSADVNKSAQFPVMHTLVTPNGGQYQVTLSDGTRVWLNAASSLKYPNAFAGAERVVELTGEGYFEVAHHTKPFKVKTQDFTVEDLGTAFDINTYKDEGNDKATLTEGSAKVTVGEKQKTLVPGQQAIIDAGNIQLTSVDVGGVKGWVNGKFVYRFTPLNAVLKDVGRWYNIEIDNQHTASSHLKATIDRNVPLDQMMRILEVTADVKLKWDGKKLTVLP